MKKLVTGGAGFMGSAIVRELLRDGEHVKVLVRKSTDTRSIDDLDVEKIYGDIRDPDSVRLAMKGCDTAYLVAAHFQHWTPNKRLPYEINCDGTRISLQAALDCGLQKVVYTSTNNTIGVHGSVPVNESAEFNLWKSGDHYSISKYLGELEAKKFAAIGLPVVIVNPTMVVGSHDFKPTPSGQVILDVVRGKMPGYVDGGCCLIDVEDVARGHILAAKKGRIGERYLFGNANMSYKDYFDLIARVAGVRPPRLKVSRSIALGLGYANEFLSFFSRRPPTFTAAAIRIVTGRECYDCSKAIQELGLPQTPVETTIAKAVNWFREEGMLELIGSVRNEPRTARSVPSR